MDRRKGNLLQNFELEEEVVDRMVVEDASNVQYCSGLVRGDVCDVVSVVGKGGYLDVDCSQRHDGKAEPSN
jgi:hypothetical protein